MRTLLAALPFVSSVLLASPAMATDLIYWGLQQEGSDSGVIELGGQLHAVRVGDVIPNWGTVHEVSAGKIVVMRPVSPEEQHRLRGEGKAVIEAEVMHIVNIQGMLPRVVPRR